MQKTRLRSSFFYCHIRLSHSWIQKRSTKQHVPHLLTLLTTNIDSKFLLCVEQKCYSSSTFNSSSPKNCSCSPTVHCSMQKRCAPDFPRVLRRSRITKHSVQYMSVTSSISFMTETLFILALLYIYFIILLRLIFICPLASFCYNT